MDITKRDIDNGRAFDWGRTSEDYARYRDIYPQEFYDRILCRGLCSDGQRVLDIGTGTGVIPRNMYRYGAKWTGSDISAEQIEQARRLSDGMDIDYYALPAEKLSFPDGTFDVITACQCMWYFDHSVTAPLFGRLLREGGRLLFLYMAWLPFEDSIAAASEEIVLKYSPEWSGGRETVHPIVIPEEYNDCFELVNREEYRLKVHFTRESWNGRMKACRGVGATLPPERLAEWEEEHTKMLEKTAPPEFDVKHYAAIAELKKYTR